MAERLVTLGTWASAAASVNISSCFAGTVVKITSGAWIVRIGVWVVGACLVAPYSFAQDPVPTEPDGPESPAEARTFSLSGSVINSVTGEPVPHAAVQVSGQNGSLALADAAGHFLLGGLSEGNVFLSAMKPGFFADEVSNTPAQVGEDAPAVVLKLTPWGVIKGRVTTKDELPLEGLQVRLFARQNVEGRMVWADQPFQGRTDDQGEFRIPGLQAGSYYVAVDQSAEAMLTQKGVANPREQVSTRMFYPGVPDMSAAGAIELAAGSETEVDFTVSPEPVYHVAGSLSGAARAVSNLTFRRKAGEDTDFTQNVAVQDGKFEANIPAGAYEVSGQGGEGTELTTAGSTVWVRTDETDVQVPLTAPMALPVEFVREQGSAGAERTVAMHEGVPGLL